VTLNVVLYSYLDRPIFDIYLNDVDLGVASAHGGTGIISGVTIPLGVQTLTWRLDGPRGMHRNGETVTVREPLTVRDDLIDSNVRYLGVHVYPDQSAELTLSQWIPDTTPRGNEILKGSTDGK
jgi:hypothetical protein